ncbi:hypothetical protein [Psychrobacter sp. JCM 18902]|uniref:hypothetical protein n=1 Tax=Psychrobacter sp. JCM 18902 TaxID=1298607 RepID=UPI0019187276|nr:hypothetical protein [Psychrobacter sp. JCM 18902]
MNLNIIVFFFLATVLASCTMESQPTPDKPQLKTKETAHKKPLLEVKSQSSTKKTDSDNNISVSIIDNSIIVQDANIVLGNSFNKVQDKLNMQLLKDPVSDNCFLVTVDNSLSLEFFNDELIFMSVSSGGDIITDKGLSLDDTFETLNSIYPDLIRSEVPAIGGDESFTPITITYSTNHNLKGDYMVFMLTDDNKVDDIGVYNINKDNDVCEIY